MNRRSEIANLPDLRKLRRVVTSCRLAVSESRLEGSRTDVLKAPLKPEIRFLAGLPLIPKKAPRPKTSFVFFLAKIAMEAGRHKASHGTKGASSAECSLTSGRNFPPSDSREDFSA